MSLTVIQCPNCNGEVQVDDSRDFGFCMYCGSKIQLKTTVDIDGVDSLNNLLNRARDFVRINRKEEAKKAYTEIMDKYPDNFDAKFEYLQIALDYEYREYTREEMISEIMDYLKNNTIYFDEATGAVKTSGLYDEVVEAFRYKSENEYINKQVNTHIPSIDNIQNKQITGNGSIEIVNDLTYISDDNQMNQLINLINEKEQLCYQRFKKLYQMAWGCLEPARRIILEEEENQRRTEKKACDNAFANALVFSKTPNEVRFLV